MIYLYTTYLMGVDIIKTFLFYYSNIVKQFIFYDGKKECSLKNFDYRATLYQL